MTAHADRRILLAVETATDACSAALANGETITERFEIAPRRHTDLILPMIESLLREAGVTAADLHGIVFGAGPGSFTGVRIAASIAQGIALAHDHPVVGISSLAILACGALRCVDAKTVTPMLDARRGQVYWAHYRREGDRVAALGDERLTAAAEIDTPAATPWCVVGTGAVAYADALGQRFGTQLNIDATVLYPRAADALILGRAAFAAGRGAAAETAQPIYLRDGV